MQSASGLSSRPRLLGLLQMGIGLVLLGTNVGLMIGLERYYAILFVGGFGLVGGGLWQAITGRTAPRAGERKQPLWWSIGLFTLLIAGALVGLYVAIRVGKS
jgi:hypothetical protein